MDKNKIKIVVSSALVLTTIATGTVGLTFKLKKDNEIKKITSESTETITNFNNNFEPITIELETTRVDYTEVSKQDIKNDVEETQTQTKKEEYTQQKVVKSEIGNDIYSKIDEVCKKNNYSSETKKYMNKMMEYIIKNYDSNYDIFKSQGFPDKQEFCLDFLEKIEHNNPSIIIFEANDKEFQSYKNELDYYGGCGLFVPNRNEVIVSSYGNEFETCKVLFEELVHSTQEYSYSNLIDKKVYYSLVEGEPAFYKCFFMDNIDIDNYSYLIYDNKDGNYEIVSAEGSSDAINSKYYIGLLSLTDYDTMQELKNGNGIMPVLKQIKEDYGVNTSVIYNCLVSGENSTKEDINNFEKIYCDCIKIKLNDISSKEELNDLFNSYRFYRTQFGVRSFDEDYKNIINEKIPGYEETERLFLEKINEYNLFDCDENEVVFNALMCKYDNSRSDNIERSINNLYFEDNGDNIFIYSKNCDTVQMCNKETGSIINMNKSQMKELSYSNKVVSERTKTY